MIVMPLYALHHRRSLATLLLLAAACGGDTADAKPDASPTATKAGAPGAPAGGGGAPGGAGAARGGGSVILSAVDIYKVAPGLIEEGTPISGDLRPIEIVSVRSRIEGDLELVAVREGQQVSAGTLLARLESTEQEAALRSAEADKLSAQTEAQTASWNHDQAKELFKAGAIAERELRTADQTAAAAAARLAAAEARLRSAAAVARDTRVLAPANGTIQFRRVQGGERVTRGQELFTLVRAEMLELTAAVPARSAGAIKIGQEVRIAADGRSIAGKVARISPTVDPASRSVTVYVQVANRDGTLKGNTFATGQIVQSSSSDGLILPQGAIRQPQPGKAPFVWKIEGGELTPIEVKLGILDEARGVAQLLEGLVVGDEIVVGNVGTLGKGMKVQIIGTEANRPRQ